MPSLSHRLGMNARELRKALWLGAVLMAVTGSYTLVKTARDSLFLSLLPAQWLPWVYLVVGAFTLGVSVVVERLTKHLSPGRSLVTTITWAAAGLVLFAVGLSRGGQWLPALFYLFVNAYGLVIVAQFWLYTNSRSDPREMKRICGIIGAGAIFGGLAAGVFATNLAHIGLPWLIGTGAILLAASAPLMGLAHRQEDPRAEPESASVEEAPVPVMRVPYVRWLALATLCSVIVTGLLDYQLKIVVQERYPTTPQLTAFFGRFYLSMNLVALVIQLAGTRRLLEWLGASSSAAVLPAGLALGAGATIAMPGFGAVLYTRLWDQIARFTLNKSAVELLFLPLPPGLKRRSKAFIGAGIERVGDALAGLLILGAGVVLHTTASVLASMVLVLVAIWLVASIRLHRYYLVELGRSLRRMTLDLDREPIALHEGTLLKEAVQMLSSPYERVVLQAIDVLDQNAPPLLDRRLPDLFTHASGRVRARALERMLAAPGTVDRHRVNELLHDRNPLVRLTALRAHCGLGGDRPLVLLDEYLRSDDPEMRSAALACVMEQVDEHDVPAVRALIDRYLSGGSSADRAAVATALGDHSTSPALTELIPPLFDDPDREVRCAALRGAGCAGLIDYLPRMVGALAAVDTEASAREGLRTLGDNAVDQLAAILCDPQADRQSRRAIPRVLGDLATPRALEALFCVRDRSDLTLSYRLLKAANHIRQANPELDFPRSLIEEDIKADVGDFLRAEFHAESLTAHREESPAADEDTAARARQFLSLVLRERMAQAFNRLFRRLGLLYPQPQMFSAYLATLSSDARVRANAAEYVEHALSPELKALVLPLLPGAKRADRVELAKTRFALDEMTSADSLAALLDGDDAWLRACALHVAGAGHRRDLIAHIAPSMTADDDRVRETAIWAHAAVMAG